MIDDDQTHARARGCERKNRYRSKAHARRVMRGARLSKTLRVYFCSFCHGFHLASK